MEDATPCPGINRRQGPLGNHRHLGKTEHAVIELIPAPKPDTWHVTVFGPGRIAIAAQPVPVAVLTAELATSGVHHGQEIRWRKRWHRSVELNPHLKLVGKVYTIVADTGLIKIGTTVDVLGRVVDLRGASPTKLELLSAFDGGYQVERLLHAKLKTHRHHGEWFNPDPKVLAALDRCLTAHGLYDLAKVAVPWVVERGPEEWERPRKGRLHSTGAWAELRRAGLDGSAL